MTAPFAVGVVGDMVSARRLALGEALSLLVASVEPFSASSITLTKSAEARRNGRPATRPADHSLARPRPLP